MTASISETYCDLMGSSAQAYLVHIFLACLLCSCTFGQSELSRQDSFNQKRFWTVTSTGALIYTATVIGLNEAWYKDHERTSFHFFNDKKEWLQMDKMGHAFTSYFETELSYRAALWTGIRPEKAVWTAAGVGMLLQTTVELLDAYSAEWGFSIYDMAFNVAGVSLFVSQELWWQEQRIRFKISSTKRRYDPSQIWAVNSTRSSSLSRRADSLFGQSLLERYLKDYNAQTIWLSFNPSAFLENDRIPRWLNLAIGYGSENLYGGFENTWVEGTDLYKLDPHLFARERQWYLSPDVDFTKIKTNNKLLQTVFRILNFFKIPAPALELNGKGKLRWHWLHL